MKYNLSLLKNKKIQFQISENGKELKFSNVVKDIKQVKNYIVFIFNECKFEIHMDIFINMLVREENDTIILKQDNKKEFLSSFIGFTMFDTYGFPIELTQEFFEDSGFTKNIDIEGFNILRKLQKEKSNGTFKNKNAF